MADRASEEQAGSVGMASGNNLSAENVEKLAYFQDVTGVEDEGLSMQILEAHGWDLDAAVSSLVGEEVQETSVSTARVPSGFVVGDGGGMEIRSDSSRWGSSGEHPNFAGHVSGRDDPEGFGAGTTNPGTSNYERFQSTSERTPMNFDRFREYNDMYRGRGGQVGPPGVVWRLVTLPFSIVRGSFNLMYGAVGLGAWAAGGVLSYSMGALGLLAPGERGAAARALMPIPSGAAEASLFVRNFEREYGEIHPRFQTMSFMEALRSAGQNYKFLFVYLHSPDHANTPAFCEKTLCSEAVSQFVSEHFVVWGGDVRTSEGFQMSNSLKASTFPFCAVVTASSNQRIALLQQVEGPQSALELLAVLQRVVDEQGAVLVAARVEEEERQLNRQLREEQDAAYQAALLADQERERRRQEEADIAARKAEEEEKKRLEEVEAVAKAEREAAERASSLERRREEKAVSLGVEPQKGPDVTQVLVRLPNGERKERRFFSHEPVQKVYDYVDSLGSFDAVKYSLVSNFPRTVYGPAKLGLSLKEGGLHPNAILFVQVEDN